MEEEINKTELLGESGETTESLIGGLTKRRGGRTRVNPTLESQEAENSPDSKVNEPTPVTQVAIEESASRQLEEAANLLLGLLDSSLKEFVFETADLTLKIPRWQLLLGSLIAQNESGNLVRPSLDPSWQGGNLVALKGYSICEECKKPFHPQRFGQKFCSNKCGDEARKRDILKMRAQRAADIKLQREILEAQRRGVAA